MQTRLTRVLATTPIPVWAGEMRYEEIEPDWCGIPHYVVTADMVVTDALAAIDAGASAILYGHNARWQWGHGVAGLPRVGYASVAASYDSPGQFQLIPGALVAGLASGLIRIQAMTASS